jgi:hypothetical protein
LASAYHHGCRNGRIVDLGQASIHSSSKAVMGCG